MSESVEINTGEIVEVNNENLSIGSEIATLASGTSAMYSSIKGNDFGAKLATLKAMTNSQPIAENLKKTIQLANIIVQPVALENERTKKVETQPRITLIDADGAAYHGTSIGLWSSVKNILGVAGEPHTWPAPLPMQVVKEGKGTSQYFTIQFA